MIYGWTPGIGDPNIMGWLTVLAYVAAALLCVRAARRDWTSDSIWILLAAAMMLLGINKQLDLQSLFTAVLRHWALADNWYGDRRALQKEFIEIIAACAAVIALVILSMMWRRSAQLKVAMMGLVALLAFVVIRAASFHHMDRLLHTSFMTMTLNVLLEMGAIGIVALGAARVRSPLARRRARSRGGSGSGSRSRNGKAKGRRR